MVVRFFIYDRFVQMHPFPTIVLGSIAGMLICCLPAQTRAQNLFASDTVHIYQFTPNGAYTGFATSPGYITGLAVDNVGNLYYADANHGTVVKVAPDGTSTTFATGLIQPTALAFNKAGDLFVSQVPGTGAGTGSILEFSPNGAHTVFATGLNSPAHITFNGAGDLFVSDAGGSSIYQFSSNGTRSTFATVSGQLISGLAFNRAGDLFVAAGGTAGLSTNLRPTPREPLLPWAWICPETWRLTNPVTCLCPSLELLPISSDSHRMELGPASPPP
jgi:hypothetical protein